MKTHNDGIWISESREQATIQKITDCILANGYHVQTQNNNNHGYPYEFTKNGTALSCRLVDIVQYTDITITDNHALLPTKGKLISVLPEFWGQWRFNPVYVDRKSTLGFNCFMSRERGDRDRVFKILKSKNLLAKGFVSYLARGYDTVNNHGTLEQCILDSNISLILETYVLDSQIAFSEKIFRALQLPRPWLLYCSPHSIKLLKSHGFDILDDYVDIAYDNILSHWTRLDCIIDQLKRFVDKTYTSEDYKRFAKAANHNQNLLQNLADRWPTKLKAVLNDISN